MKHVIYFFKSLIYRQRAIENMLKLTFAL